MWTSAPSTKRPGGTRLQPLALVSVESTRVGALQVMPSLDRDRTRSAVLSPCTDHQTADQPLVLSPDTRIVAGHCSMKTGSVTGGGVRETRCPSTSRPSSGAAASRGGSGVGSFQSIGPREQL